MAFVIIYLPTAQRVKNYIKTNRNLNDPLVFTKRRDARSMLNMFNVYYTSSDERPANPVPFFSISGKYLDPIYKIVPKHLLEIVEV